MKTFQTMQRNLALIGFERNLRPFNERHKWCVIVGSTSNVILITYLLNVANSPKEYMDSIFVVCVAILMIISQISLILKTEIIFILIDEIEEIIGASEF